MKVGSLFSGIGGLDLGLERAGMEIRWQVENDKWCQKILAKHWPDIPCYGDIHDINPADLEPVDLICGGFPCQPVSLAGKRKAQDDDRWLWPEFARIVCVVRPRYVLVENVPGLFTAGFGEVAADLAALGYDMEWESIPAAAVGAPHLRWRIFLVAHTDTIRWDGRARVFRPAGRRQLEDKGGSEIQIARGGDATGTGDVAHTDGQVGGSARSASQTVFRSGPLKRSGRRGSSFGEHWAIEPDVGRVAHGIPRRVDRLRGLGNAVVPQVAEWVGQQIMESESTMMNPSHWVCR